jgi:hypothetical protein
MNLEIKIDLDELYSYCDDSVTTIIKEEIATEIGKTIRKAVREGLTPDITKKIADASKIAYTRSVAKALKEFK